ncbi:MAG TPA: IPT/TIG domain-containing protein [Egibacteraceae bacterium]|nr:IPT/TIG domain-containing protein [Egibacteraceae bacterium]
MAQRRAQARGSLSSVAAAVSVALAATGLTVLPAPPAQAATATKIEPAVTRPGLGVSILGDGLTGATGVTFLGGPGEADDVAAVETIVVDAKRIVAQVPAGARSGPVAVAHPDGTVSTAPAIVTIVDPPQVASLSDGSGRPGQEVEVRGSQLVGLKAPAVMIGAKKAPVVRSAASAVTVKVPAGLVGGPTTLTLQTEGGSAAHPFTVAPDVKAVAPKAGSTAGGSVISVTGTGFTGVDAFTDDPSTPADERLDGVTVGGVRATQVVAVSDKEVVAATPASATSGPAPVVVSTTAARTVVRSGSAATFTYQPLPSVTDVSPAWNAVGTARAVTLTGHNLRADSTVVVGKDTVTATANATTGTLRFTPPVAAKAGQQKIVVTNIDNAGKAFATTVPFTYIQEPTVTGLKPASAPAGATVTVAGTSFTPDTTVAFGNRAASCTTLGFASLRCTVPQGSGSAAVRVTNPLGTSAQATAPTFTYVTATKAPAAPPGPAVTALVPAYGRPGTTVDVRGASLEAVTRVEFTNASGAWVNAPNFLSVGPKRLVVSVPTGAASGPLRLTSPAGRIRTDSRPFTASARPRISTIDVVGDATLAVAGGDMVQIKGTNLVVAGVRPTVTIGGKPAPLLTRPVPTASTIIARVPAGTGGRADVVVTTPLGTVTAGSRLYYVPQIKAVTPLTANRDGGVVATITGSAFTGADANEIGLGRREGVTFGGVPAAKLVVMSDTQIVAVTAPESATADAVVVTSRHGTWSGNSDDEVRPVSSPVPVITAITPDRTVVGSEPEPVTITGSNLRETSVVRFGDEQVVVDNASGDGTAIVVQPPTRSVGGAVAVSIVNEYEGQELSVSVAEGYRYVERPVVTQLSPTAGLAGRVQAAVTLTGLNLRPNTVVRFGTRTGSVQSAAPDGTSLLVIPPVQDEAGVVNVVVTNFVDGEEHEAVLFGAYRYEARSGPQLTSVAPATAVVGQVPGPITVTGANLASTSTVLFGAVAGTVQSAAADGSSLIVLPPRSTIGGAVDVTVTNVVYGHEMSATLPSAFRYLPTPSITDVSPGVGWTGVTPPPVTITGVNLRPNSVVRFGAAQAGVDSVNQDGTSMVVTPPVSHTAGTVAVTVTNVLDDGQQLTATRASAYRYDLAPATVTGMSAATAAAGTQVTITGTSFVGVTAVRFGATAAQFTVASPTTILATVPLAPSRAQGTRVDITVVNGTGQPSAGAPADADDWTWDNSPVVAGLSVTTGGQGSTVTLTGTGFTDATAVRFGTVDATPFTVVSDTTITAVVPATPLGGTVVNVTVTARGLVSPEPPVATANDWTWAPIAVITGINPKPAAQGSTVTVSGRNFVNVRTVTVNGVDVTASVVVVSSTSLTFVAPARPTGHHSNYTDKPVFITTASGVQSLAEPSNAHLFTWS